MITLCFPGGIHFCIHWPTAVQPLVEQVNTLLFLPSFRPKTQLEKVGKTGEKIPTGGLSLPLSTPRCFLHFPPGPAAIYLLMQCLPILFNHFSYCNQPLFLFFLFLEFFFPEGGAIWVPHVSPHWAGSVPIGLLVVFLRGLLSSCRPFLFLVLTIYFLIKWIVLSVPLSKRAILVNESKFASVLQFHSIYHCLFPQ